jgi:hypothetical protein
MAENFFSVIPWEEGGIKICCGNIISRLKALSSDETILALGLINREKKEGATFTAGSVYFY